MLCFITLPLEALIMSVNWAERSFLKIWKTVKGLNKFPLFFL